MATPAARVGDPIAHSNAMTGLLIGAALGAALAVATVATGGLAAVAAGAMIAGGVAGGALAGQYIGAASMGPPTGAITLGSPNVRVNFKPAAMAQLAMAVCAKEGGAPQPIAMGSATVLINGQPAAREGDKLVCSAVVLKGSPNVFFDDTTVTVLPIEPEVPVWLERTLQVVAIGAAVVGFGVAIAAVGVGLATAGLAGGLIGGHYGGRAGRAVGEALGLSEAQTRALETLGGLGGGLGGGLVGGAAATRAVQGLRNTSTLGRNANLQPTPSASKVCTSGCPISMLTGEELLSLDDFTWDGPLPLVWRRFYRTAQSGIDLQLGHGWVSPLDEWIEQGDDGLLSYHDAEGRRIALPLPGEGQRGHNTAEPLAVERRGDLVTIQPDEGPQRLFRLGPGRSRLLGWQQAGHRIDIARDHEGHAVALRASWGRSLLIERAGHRLSALVRARDTPEGLVPSGAPLVRYRYNRQGDLVQVLDALGQGERYAYRGHVIQRRTLASGFSFRFAWDRPGPGGRCVRNWGDRGLYDYRFEWDADGSSRAIDSRGGVTHYQHDRAGQLVRLRSPEGLVQRFVHDANGLLIEHTGPGGATHRYAYDEHGQLIRHTDPLGQEQVFTHDAQGRMASLRDPLGHTWHWHHDAQGRLSTVRDPLGAETRYTYNPQGLLAEVQPPAGLARTLWWDEAARPVAERGHDGVRRRFAWDAADRLRSIVTEDQREQHFEWDATGRLTAQVAPDGGRTELRWNAMGVLTHWRDANGATTEYRYADGLRQPSERIDPLGRVMRYLYDSERNLVGLINPKGERYTLRWDGDERLVEQTGFDGRVRRFHYDAAGQLVMLSEPTPDGAQALRQTRLERDLLGRLLTKTTADGQVVQCGYDPLGRLLRAQREGARVSDPSHVLTIAYDPLGRVIGETQDGLSLAHELDALGRRTRTVLPDGQALDYRWDERGRLEAITLDGQPLSRHHWDALGQETARDQGGLHTRYDWDPAGRLRSQATAARDGHEVLGRRYRHDAAGQVLGIDDLRQGPTRYTYDPAGQLLAVQGDRPERFVHDPAGNLLDADAGPGPQTAAPGDRLAMHGDRHFRYDSAGNRIEVRGGTGGQRRERYVYDAEHRLVAVHGPQGSSSYRYDALGRRTAKLTPQGQTQFLWDGATLVGELRLPARGARGAAANDPGPDQARPAGTGAEGLAGVACQRWYVYEPGSFRPLACVQRRAGASMGSSGEAHDAPATEVYHYHLDHLGTPREMTDARGRIVWSARYRAWGALALADVNEVDNPLRFQGQFHDSETGLHYNFQRYYDPQVGRFIHQDPIGLAGGENLYRYAPNPVNWVDPWGWACKNAAESLPRMKGMGASEREATLSNAGFGKTKVSNSAAKNETWTHADGSEVRVHPYGNERPSPYKSGNNAHLHKQDPSGNQLNDRGMVDLNPNETHIGLPNPKDLPAVRGRAHGS